MLCPTQGSREETPSNDKEAPSDITTHSAQKGIKCGNKRRKQHLQGTTTMTSCDDGHNWDSGGSGVRCTATAAHSDKRTVMPPMDHFKRLLEEACPNHAYPIKHKLKDYGMMRSFMTSGSLAWVVLAVLKPNRLICKRTNANCSSFHVRVFLGLSNSQ
jgi:hypothetical protein